eukprot:m.11910 g.11910  ORF g.11910 m.11910 type:complete len:55 (+) comp5778_c0_seq1:260-424(+)
MSANLVRMVIGLAGGTVLGMYLGQHYDLPRVQSVGEQLMERIQSESDKRKKRDD